MSGPDWHMQQDDVAQVPPIFQAEPKSPCPRLQLDFCLSQLPSDLLTTRQPTSHSAAKGKAWSRAQLSLRAPQYNSKRYYHQDGCDFATTCQIKSRDSNPESPEIHDDFREADHSYKPSADSHQIQERCCQPSKTTQPQVS